MNTEKKPRALIAMSGGVDSSVAVLLAKQLGYDCVGATMSLMNTAEGDNGGETARNSARIAEALGIPHQTLDFCDVFNKEVISPFVESYKKGETPNPCVDCNIRIKFGFLYEYALSQGFDKLVTGHYAGIVKDAGGELRLSKAGDSKKDQSYFLYGITPEKLSHILFPLCDLSKKDVRKIAAEANLECANRGESQDICFIPEGNHMAFIESYTGKASVPGNFVDMSGNILGPHGGISRYTVGQRKGLGIALGRPVFVKEIRVETNEIVLADENEVFSSRIEIENIVLHTGLPAAAEVMIRYRAKPVRAEIEKKTEGRLALLFNKPVRAPAKGQSAVLYDGDFVIGGGKIV